jgi:hypothetical protein
MCGCERHWNVDAACTCKCTPEQHQAMTFVEQVDEDHIVRGDE